MPHLKIAAQEVKIGDQLYLGDQAAKNPNHRWGNVKKVKKVILTDIHKNRDVRIVINAGGRDFWFYYGEKVSIERFDDLNQSWIDELIR